MTSPLRILFLSWRDLAHPQAGGSEVLVDRLARGALERGHRTALLCGGPVGERPYPVVVAGGDYSQYLIAPFVYLRHFRDADVLVDVENGIPFFSPLWRRRPVVCLVHHVHRDQWPMRFPRPVAAAGWFLESRVVPRLYDRYVAVSPSTAAALTELGIPADAIHEVGNGVDLPAAPGDDAAEPLFLALGRLVAYKRVDLLLRMWERVRPRTGGRLVVVGDGPELRRLEEAAGPGVEFRGRVDDDEKQSLLAAAWVLVHGAHHEGWGMVVMEAAAASTPAVAFDVPGVRDAVVDGVTGVLARSEDDFVAAWIALADDDSRRWALGAEARRRAAAHTWDRSVEAFLAVAEAAVADGHRR